MKYIVCKKKCDKAGIGFTFSKKFLDSEKKKNPNLDDAAATKAAENRFLGTMWLLNSEVSPSVTDNLVQAHISGIDNYQESVNGLSPWFLSQKRLSVAVAPPPLWLGQTGWAGDAKLVTDRAAAEVAEGVPDEAQGAVVVNQAGQTDAIGVAGVTTSTVIAPILPIVGKQKRILRWPMAR